MRPQFRYSPVNDQMGARNVREVSVWLGDGEMQVGWMIVNRPISKQVWFLNIFFGLRNVQKKIGPNV